MRFSFREYMDAFEQRVAAAGVAQGCLGRVEKVPLRDGKLAKHRFGKLMGGTRILLEDVCVIDYYGLVRKSVGFWEMVSKVRNQFVGKQVKSVEAPVVYFAAVKIEKIAVLAPELVAGFPTFKRMVLDGRGFPHNYGN